MIKSLLIKFQRPDRTGSHVDQNKRVMVQFTILGIIAVMAFLVFVIIWGIS